MDEAVRAAGGRCVRELVGANPRFDNADYVFADDGVVGELKSLEKDFLSDPTVEDKMHQLYNQWVNDGKDVPLIFGHGTLSTDQLPLECRRELVGIFKDRIERTLLRKANLQIRATKDQLNHPDAIGLLLLSNEGNFAFDPATMTHVLLHSLRAKFSSIEHVIFFSANLVVGGVGTSGGIPLFASIRFPDRREPSNAFLNRLGSCWYDSLGRATNKSFPPFGFASASSSGVVKLRFRPR